MKYLMIENDGEVDVMAFTLMGASSKRGEEGKIGFFGSGNKYAIANLLRRDIDFKIYSGTSTIDPVTVPVYYRGKSYQKICFQVSKDGEAVAEMVETSITTDMGPKWEPWYILRELYCNAIDEGGCKLEVVEDINVVFPEVSLGVPGKTRIFVEMVGELIHVMNHWNAYFTRDRLDLIETVNSGGEDFFDIASQVLVYHKYDDKFRIYRKGVLIYAGDEKSIYDYDVPDAEINEERIVQNMSKVRATIGRTIASGASQELIIQLTTHMDKHVRSGFGCIETGMGMEYYVQKNPVNWSKAISGMTIINSGRKESYVGEAADGKSMMMDSALAYALNSLNAVGANILGVPKKGLKHSFKEVHCTADQQKVLDKAFEFLTLAGFDFGDIRIQPVVFDDYAIAGMADITGNLIYVGQASFDKGIKYTVSCLMEEHAHIKSRMGDETRAFQNYLIDRWLCEIEDRLGVQL